MIEAYVTNLGRYNEGHLDSEVLKLPATKEDVQALLSKIKVDGIKYEEIFIADYETKIYGLKQCLGEYESLDELNYLASILEDMDEWDVMKFEAALDFGEYTSSVENLINLAQNLDNYDYISDIKDHDELGQYVIEEMGGREIPDWIGDYFDYDGYGRDFDFNGNGRFTEKGYILDNDGSFIEHYKGRDDLPEEYRIFAYPEKGGPLPQMAEATGKPIYENEHLQEFFQVMRDNHSPSTNDLITVVQQISAMEKYLQATVNNLATMRLQRKRQIKQRLCIDVRKRYTLSELLNSRAILNKVSEYGAF